MKKLICAAVLAAAMCGVAEEAAPAAKATTAPAVETAKKPARPKMTEEQRAKMRAAREKYMAERKAQMEKKVLEIVKKYVPEEEKAKALVKELEETMMARRMPPRRPGVGKKPAAEAK